MITTDSLDSRDREVERNAKLIEKLEIEEVRLFDDFDLRLVRIMKNMLVDFKQKFIELLKKYYESFTWSIVNMLGKTQYGLS